MHIHSHSPFRLRALAVAAFAGGLLLSGGAFAQAAAYPSKPVTIVVPYPAGARTTLSRARWPRNWATSSSSR